MHINASLAFQQFTSTVITTAVTLSTTLMKDVLGAPANAVYVSVGGSTGAVRYRDDGTAPTSNIGMRLPSGAAPFLLQGNLQKLQFIADAVPGNADVNITYLQVADG